MQLQLRGLHQPSVPAGTGMGELVGLGRGAVLQAAEGPSLAHLASSPCRSSLGWAGLDSVGLKCWGELCLQKGLHFFVGGIWGTIPQYFGSWHFPRRSAPGLGLLCRGRSKLHDGLVRDQELHGWLCAKAT